MNNLVLQRLSKPEEKPLPNLNIVEIPKINDSPIVNEEKLRTELLKRVIVVPTIQPDNEHSMLEFISFTNVFEFVFWYEQNKDKFTPVQQQPLNNLVSARNFATGGCPCDINTRRMIAADWFRKFWTNNKTTDLPPTLLKIANAKKVIFGDFLTFP
jgi:hypothetical protein